MTLHRALGALVALCAALILSGCFVISKDLPAGDGPINDDRLVGTWQGVNADNDEPADAFLHFQKHDDQKPLRLVWVEDKGYQVYDVTTRRIGTKHVFAAMIIEPKAKAKEDGVPLGYHLGYYEVSANGNEITFYLLDGDKVSEQISKGRLKGIMPPKKYDFTTLTGSPDELARFLASPEGDAARVKDPAKLRRVSTGRKW